MKLVTGGTGFLGAHLIAELLKRGGNVRAIKRNSSDLSEFNSIINWRLAEQASTLLNHLQWVEGDVLDYESLTDAMLGADEVYHCAAIVSFWPALRDKMYQVNVEGTANVVNACLETGVLKLCHCSSIAALGRSGDGKNIDEETPWTDSSDNSNYAISKYLGEMEVWRGGVEGLKPVIVNPGVILGEGNWAKGSCRLVKKAFGGMAVYTEGKNGYVDVIDVAWVMAELMERNIINERFVLVGENLEIRLLLDRAASYKGKKGPWLKVGKVLSAIGWRLFSIKSFFDRKEPLITKETARTVSKKYVYSSEKIEKILGFRLKSVDETMKRVENYLP